MRLWPRTQAASWAGAATATARRSGWPGGPQPGQRVIADPQRAQHPRRGIGGPLTDRGERSRSPRHRRLVGFGVVESVFAPNALEGRRAVVAGGTRGIGAA